MYNMAETKRQSAAQSRNSNLGDSENSCKKSLLNTPKSLQGKKSNIVDDELQGIDEILINDSVEDVNLITDNSKAALKSRKSAPSNPRKFPIKSQCFHRSTRSMKPSELRNLKSSFSKTGLNPSE